MTSANDTIVQHMYDAVATMTPTPGSSQSFPPSVLYSSDIGTGASMIAFDNPYVIGALATIACLVLIIAVCGVYLWQSHHKVEDNV